MRQTKALLLLLLVGGMLVIAACDFSLPQGTSGSIALSPFWNQEKGIRGVQPPEGWSEEAQLIQDAIPLTGPDLMAMLLAKTYLPALPEPTGRFAGKALAWDLYTFETHLPEVPVDVVRVDLAVAENGSTGYVVAMVALPGAYDANPALFDTIFTHALYALRPVE